MKKGAWSRDRGSFLLFTKHSRLDECSARSLSHRAVVVAVVAVWMMQMSIDEIVDVVPVWDRRMTAVGAVYVGSVVARTMMIRGAVRGVLRADLEGVLLDCAVLARMVEMSVVRVVDVIAVLDRRVAAAGPVRVCVSFVVLVLSHGLLLHRGEGRRVSHAHASRAQERS